MCSTLIESNNSQCVVKKPRPKWFSGLLVYKLTHRDIIVVMARETLRPPGNNPLMEDVRNLSLLLLDVFRFEVNGEENLDFMNKTPGIFAFFPHCGHLDTLAVRKGFPPELRDRLVYPAAADYWHAKDLKGRLKSGLSSLFAENFPMPRTGSKIMEGLDMAVDYLNKGYSIVIAPEGTRTRLLLEERELRKGTAKLVL